MSLSIREVKDFSYNVVWKEIEESIAERVEMVRNDLEETPPTDIGGISSLQGEIKSLRWILALPDLIMKDLEEESGQEAEEPMKESEERDG